MTFGNQRTLDVDPIPFTTSTQFSQSEKEYEKASQTRIIMKESRILDYFIVFLFGGRMRRESSYRTGLITRIQERFPGCVILPTDPQRQQGIPDIVILFGRYWAMLELKRSKSAGHRPNQDYYVDQYNDMSFAAVIFPENEDEVLDELAEAFG